MKNLGWVLLLAALACGLTMVLPWAAPGPAAIVYDAVMIGAPVAQVAGVFVLRRVGVARGWAVIAGYAAAVAFVVAWIGATLGTAAGPGGLVYGFFMMMPGIGLGVLLQIGALIAFVRTR